MVQVRLPHPPPTIAVSRVAGREITITGSHALDAKVLLQLLDLIANKIVDPCQLVEEGSPAALEAVDRSNSLGIVMSTHFTSPTTPIIPSTTTTATRTNGCPRL